MRSLGDEGERFFVLGERLKFMTSEFFPIQRLWSIIVAKCEVDFVKFDFNIVFYVYATG